MLDTVRGIDEASNNRDSTAKEEEIGAKKVCWGLCLAAAVVCDDVISFRRSNIDSTLCYLTELKFIHSPQ